MNMNGVSSQPFSTRNLADISAGTQLDWLSYVEEDYTNDATLQSEVEKLLREEMGRIPYHPERYLAHLPPVPNSSFEDSAFLKHELERVQKGEKLPPLDVSRYSVEPPSGKQSEDIEAWKQAIKNAQAQLEHQAIKAENLELLSVYGGNQWKLYNDQLEGLKSNLQSQLEATKSNIDEVNRKRKREQTDALKEITRLEEEWHELCRKNLRIDAVTQQLEARIDAIRDRLPSAEHQQATESLD